jgi:hypothetical protein
MIVGLLRHGSLEGLRLAARALNDLLQSVDPLCRVQAAPLVTLLNDPDRRVRTAALEAAATLINRRLLPHVIDRLDAGAGFGPGTAGVDDPSTASGPHHALAGSALTRGGPGPAAREVPSHRVAAVV